MPGAGAELRSLILGVMCWIVRGHQALLKIMETREIMFINFFLKKNAIAVLN